MYLDTDPPLILSFRLGLLGFATGAIIRDDNVAAGEEGTGNYGLSVPVVQLLTHTDYCRSGLRDQRTAMEWLHHHIGEFGGDSSNITLIGSGSGAADIVAHLLSKHNASTSSTSPRLFSRCIIQSPIFEPILPSVSSAGWALSRMMSALGVSSSIEKFRKVEVEKILAMGLGQTLRVVDDGVWFRKGWGEWFTPTSSSSSFQHAPLQPIIIGDTTSDSLLWSNPISLWTSSGVVRRLKAICQSLSKTSNVLRAYDIGSNTPDDEIMERVLELVDDARVGWPTEIVAQAVRKEHSSIQDDGQAGKVWRYVFDQEGPARGVPHYAADLMYLFDVKPASLASSSSGDECKSTLGSWDYTGPYEVDEDEQEEKEKAVASCAISVGSMSLEAALAAAAEAAASGQVYGAPRIDPYALCSSIASTSGTGTPQPSGQHHQTLVDDADWLISTVDEYAYARVRDMMQQKWLAFAYGESPWTPWETPLASSSSNESIHHQDHRHHHHHQHAHHHHSHSHPSKSEKVFVFGPEGETGERSSAIFEGRRRRHMWSEVLEPLGWALVQKFGVELSRGPALGADRAR